MRLILAVLLAGSISSAQVAPATAQPLECPIVGDFFGEDATRRYAGYRALTAAGIVVVWVDRERCEIIGLTYQP